MTYTLVEDDFRFNRVVEPTKTDHCQPISWDARFPPLSEERREQVLEKMRPKAVPPKRVAVRVPQTYLVGAEGSPLVKIGYTGTDPKQRLKALQTGQPMALTLLWVQTGNYEDDLHSRFAPYRIRGEWFDLRPLGDPVAAVKAAVEEIALASGRSALD